MGASLPLPLNSVQALLQGFAGSELFWPVWQSCFGGDFDRRLASELQNQWRKGDFRDLPQIVVLPGKALGFAQGAYAAATDTVFLAEAFVRGASEEALVAVILEEIGHSVDARVNQRDSPGDEGAVFSALVRQEEVSPIQLAALQREQDGGTAILNGRTVAVEQSTAVSLVASFTGFRYANDVRIAGKYAYIADFLSPTADLVILDISSANNPTLAGLANGMGNLSDVDISPGIAYATDGSAGLRVIDTNSPSVPGLKSTYNSPGDAQDVKIVGNIAYLSDGTSGLQIINISNPLAPVLQATAGVAIGVTGSVSAVDVAGNLAVIVSKGVGTGRLQTLNVSNPNAPTKTGEVAFALEGAAQTVQIVGTTAYLAAGNRGLKIFDISNPAAPKQKGEYFYNSTAEAQDVQVVGGYAFVAYGLYGLEIIDVRNPSAPVLAASYKPSTRYFGMSVSNTTTSVEVTGNYAYLTVQASKDLGGLWILDVSPFTATIQPPSITLAVAATNSVTEDGAANLLYTFSRTGLTTSALTVNYTVGGTARLVATTSDSADYRFAGSTSTATSRTVTFAAGSATATVTVDPTADTRAEANEIVTLQLAAGTGYTLATTAAVSGTIRNDDIIGTAANNVLIGTADADLIDGLAGTDTLTGLAGADRFAFRFSQSSITASDRLTDFAFNSDKITLLSATGSPLPLPSAFSRAADNPTASTLLQLSNSVFADTNGALAGNQPLAPNAAVLVRATNSAIAGTYLLINDPASPLNANIDLLINLTGHSGTLPAIGAIAADRVFA